MAGMLDERVTSFMIFYPPTPIHTHTLTRSHIFAFHRVTFLCVLLFRIFVHICANIIAIRNLIL
jgi:hypothetical protein